MKICKDCKITKSFDEFPVSGKSKLTGKVWYRGRCRKCYNLKFKPPTGLISLTRFKKGAVPWNKNTCGVMKANSGSFKKGNIPVTRKEIDGRQSLKSKQWAIAVKERDNNICQKCLASEQLHAHHVKDWDNFPELRFCLNNGLTLCNSCHSKLHGKINGYKNGLPGWWMGKRMTIKQRKKLSDGLKKYYAKKRLEKERLESLN